MPGGYNSYVGSEFNIISDMYLGVIQKCKLKFCKEVIPNISMTIPM